MGVVLDERGEFIRSTPALSRAESMLERIFRPLLRGLAAAYNYQTSSPLTPSPRMANVPQQGVSLGCNLVQ